MQVNTFAVGLKGVVESDVFLRCNSVGVECDLGGWCRDVVSNDWNDDDGGERLVSSGSSSSTEGTSPGGGGWGSRIVPSPRREGKADDIIGLVLDR